MQNFIVITDDRCFILLTNITKVDKGEIFVRTLMLWENNLNQSYHTNTYTLNYC